MKPLSIFVLFSLLSGGVVSAQSTGEGPPPALVKLAAVRLVQMAPTLWMPGSVLSDDDARISADVQGRLVYVTPVGDSVTTDDTLAQVDDTELRLEYAETEAVLIREQAELAFSDQELKRLAGLVKNGLVSTNRLDLAKATRNAADAERLAAQAKLNRIEDRLQRTIIKAPFDGVVTERYRQVGERVDVGDQVVRLVNPNSLELRVKVPAANLPFLPVGSRVFVKTPRAEAQASVRSVVPVGDDVSRLYDIRLSLSNGSWPAGTTVRVAIPTAHAKDVVAVPRDALVLRRDGPSVFSVDNEKRARKVAVKTGVASGDLIEVMGDVNVGDQVVIRGNERLRPGQPLTVLEN